MRSLKAFSSSQEQEIDCNIPSNSLFASNEHDEVTKNFDPVIDSYDLLAPGLRTGNRRRDKENDRSTFA